MSDSEIVSGLVSRVGTVLLMAVIDEQKRSFTVVQRGETLNGDAGAIERAKVRLAARVKRTRPDLKAD